MSIGILRSKKQNRKVDAVSHHDRSLCTQKQPKTMNRSTYILLELSLLHLYCSQRLTKGARDA